jgi:uncharacterized protein
MQIREMSQDECRALLLSTNLARLACVRYNQPYIVPIYFDFYEDALYSFAMAGRKIQWMRANPRVCVEVDDIVDRFNWTTVVVKGRFEELTRTPAHEAARKRACLLFQNRPDWWYPAAGKLRAGDTRTPVIYRVQIDSMSGRQAARDPARIARAKPAAAATKAPHWWSHVLRPLQGPPRGIE